MHTVEALLAAGDVTNNRSLIEMGCGSPPLDRWLAGSADSARADALGDAESAATTAALLQATSDPKVRRRELPGAPMAQAI